MIKILICYAAKFGNGLTILNHRFVSVPALAESDIKYELGLIAALEQTEYAQKSGADIGLPELAIVSVTRLD